jgi:uncharacterized membrane protein
MARILLAGEQVTAAGFELKGFDYFGTHAYKEDGQTLVQALTECGHAVEWLRTCHVPTQFPENLAGLQEYDTLILSDVGSNSLLFHPEMLARSVRHPNRLALVRDYVREGGSLLMVGGWMSFAGVDGRARYHRTPIEEALPVTCEPYDDRHEAPEGVTPEVVDGTHPALAGLPAAWPYFLGYNRVTAKPGAAVLLSFGADPLLAGWDFGQGRAAAFTSDCAPHWGPPVFLEWSGYPRLWDNLVRWLTRA